MSVERDHPELTAPTQAVWEGIARWWDERVGEGDDFQVRLVRPATERLLEARPGQYVLDLACGNGGFARRLAEQGCRVLACDFSPTFLERARARSAGQAGQVEYRLADLCDRGQLLALGGPFDAAVCTMAVMDMATVTPLLEGLRVLLRPGGRFVFSVLHPCFNSTGCSLVAELEDRDGELRTTHAVKVTRYLSLGPTRGVGIRGQPQPHYYFNRPLGTLFSACFRAGFALTGLEEPAFPESAASRPLTWESCPDIPPALVARMELPVAGGA
jgi:2-polyprenyl-3-methyl-5-hydroxy-6-metoxy-1,4-benzoquinol methylase